VSLDLVEAFAEFFPALFDAAELLCFPACLPAGRRESILPCVAAEPALWTVAVWRRCVECVAAKAGVDPAARPAPRARTSSNAFARMEPLACKRHVGAAIGRWFIVMGRLSIRWPRSRRAFLGYRSTELYGSSVEGSPRPFRDFVPERWRPHIFAIQWVQLEQCPCFCPPGMLNERQLSCEKMAFRPWPLATPKDTPTEDCY